MLRRLIALGLIGTCLCQYNQEQQNQQYEQPYSKDGQYRPPIQILSHKQSLNHDGNFKYAFATENGLLQGESVSPDGSRTGAYAYVDPTGRKISVKYVAGKEGFKILEGDHIPKPPPQVPLGPHPGYAQYNQQNSGAYTPEVPKHVYQYKPELPKSVYPLTKPSFPQYKADFRPGAASVGPQIFNRPPAYTNNFVPEKLNEVQPYSQPSYGGDQTREPEYNDEPGKANSFGTGYSFEFAG